MTRCRVLPPEEFCFSKSGQGFLTPSSLLPGRLCVRLVLSSTSLPQSPFPSWPASLWGRLLSLARSPLPSQLVTLAVCALFNPQLHPEHAGHFPAQHCSEPHCEPPEPFSRARGCCTTSGLSCLSFPRTPSWLSPRGFAQNAAFSPRWPPTSCLTWRPELRARAFSTLTPCCVGCPSSFPWCPCVCPGVVCSHPRPCHSYSVCPLAPQGDCVCIAATGSSELPGGGTTLSYL